MNSQEPMPDEGSRQQLEQQGLAEEYDEWLRDQRAQTEYQQFLDEGKHEPQ